MIAPSTHPSRSLRSALVLLPLLALAACEPGASDDPEVAEAPPSLVVLVTVDQLRADLLTRYDSLFTGGLRRLLDQGRAYTGASHRHAYTETAPGHATLATGRYPSGHGIVANSFYEVQDDGTLRSRYAVEDTTSPVLGFPGLSGRSPRNLLADGLADWVLAADPGARVLSISAKDRSAISTGGRTADAERVHVYWLNTSARRFVTSAFYRTTYPSWVERFNRDRMPELLGDTVWAQSVPEAWRVLARPDSAPYEGDGVHVTFPHLQSQEAGPAEDQRNRWYGDTPFPDRALVALAGAALDTLELGRRGVVDLLAISFSQTDYVGHDYGPLSQEQLDNLLHLDRVLDELLTLLDARVGQGRWVLGLSGDHGVLTTPEYLVEQGVPAQRAGPGYRDEVEARVQAVLDRETSEEAVRSGLAQALEELPYIADVFGPEELENPADSFAILYRNSSHPTRRGDDLPQFDLMVRPAEHALVSSSSRGTTHGSPYWYDRWVPFVLVGPGVEAGQDASEVYTVDLAPTLARLVRVPFPDNLDGRALGGGG